MSSSNFDSTDLPALQPRTQCVLIPRDPNYIYAYWDYTQEDINNLRNQLKFESEDFQLILRVYDTTGGHTWDLDVGFSTKNWYIHVWQDNAEYYTELGMRLGENRFISLTRSNTVRTPAKTSSKRDDLIWQDIKIHKESQPYIKENIKDRYQGLMKRHSKKRPHQLKNSPKARLYHLTAQDIRNYYMKLFVTVSPKGRNKKQEEIRFPSMGNILKVTTGNISWQKVQPLLFFGQLIYKAPLGASLGQWDQKGDQPGAPSGASESLVNAQSGGSEGRLNKRKFFFEIWTELIVHGRTEPDAEVWLNKNGVKLNPDGTFSLRYALPDGEIPLKFIAQSSDGVEQRHIYTRVEREKTIGFPKMLKEFNG